MSATSKPTYISLTSSNPGKIKALIVSRLMSVAFDTVHFVQTIGDAKKENDWMSKCFWWYVSRFHCSLRSGEQSLTCLWCCRKKRGIDFQGWGVDSGQCQQNRILQGQLRPRKLGTPFERPGDRPTSEPNTLKHMTEVRRAYPFSTVHRCLNKLRALPRS